MKHTGTTRVTGYRIVANTGSLGADSWLTFLGRVLPKLPDANERFITDNGRVTIKGIAPGC